MRNFLPGFPVRNRTSGDIVRAGVLLALFVPSFLPFGCAHPRDLSENLTGGGAGPTERGPLDPNRISEGEIGELEFHTAYEVIQTLRPQWLRSRGVNSFIDPTPSFADVFLDGTFIGKLEYLWNVSAMNVKELRFWGPAEAGVRFGMGYPRGVIEITSKGLP